MENKSIMENSNLWDGTHDSAHPHKNAAGNDNQWQHEDSYEDDAPDYLADSSDFGLEPDERYASEDDPDDEYEEGDDDDEELEDWGHTDPSDTPMPDPMDPSGPGSAV